MLYPFITRLAKVLVFSLLIACAIQAQVTATREQSSSTQLSLEAKLALMANYVPESKEPREQLIEVAKRFKIPMGIEWVEQSAIISKPLSLETDATVQHLISAILQQIPEYQQTIENGVLHVSQAAFASEAQNQLNLRISRFSVTDRNLLEAQSSLRLAIEMTLYPDEYTEGYISDSGYPPGHVFTLNTITFKGSNLTVREILDSLIKANDNALWLARLNRKAVRAGENSSSAASEQRRSTGLGQRAAQARKRQPAPSDFELVWELIPLTDKTDDSNIKTRRFTVPGN